MKKIELKKNMQKRVQSTEWTDADTWKVLDQVRKAAPAPKVRWTRSLLPMAAALVLALCVGVVALNGRPGTPDEIRSNPWHTLQPISTPLSQGIGQDAETTEDTVLFYHPTGGAYYHRDPDCRLVHEKYRPLKGQFTYGQIGEEAYRDLIPCPVCGAPARPEAEETVKPAAKATPVIGSKPVAGQYSLQNIRLMADPYYPEIASQLQPVESSCEDQGIRLTVHAALVKDNDLWVVYSLQDLEANRINPQICTNHTCPVGTNGISDSVTLAYDSSRHLLLMLEHTRYDETTPPEDGLYPFSMYSIYTRVAESMSLIPILKQHGITSEGISLPENCRVIYTPTGRKDMPILDYSKPLDISLGGSDNTVLTGIGWIDGKLHVQFREAASYSIDHDYSWLSSVIPGKNLSYADDYQLIWYDHAYRNTNWVELVFDAASTDPDQLELEVEFSHAENSVSGIWSAVIPVGSYEEETGTEQEPASAEEALQMYCQNKTDRLKPLNLSCEDRGIRLEVISGLVEGNESWLLCSLQDLEGDRIDRSTANCLTTDTGIGELYSYSGSPLYYDEVEHKLTFIVHNTYDVIYRPADGFCTFSISDTATQETVYTDLTPFLNQHASSAESVLPPENAHFHASVGNTVTEERQQEIRVLDYSRSLDIPMEGDSHTRLSAIGWIDGQLHVQFYETPEEPENESESSCLSWLEYLNLEYSDIYHVSWQDPETDSAGWEEFILDPETEDLSLIKLEAVIIHSMNRVDDSFEVRIPYDAIQEYPDRTDAVALPYGDNIRKQLSHHYEFSRIAKDLKPVGLSREDRGVRLNVYSVLLNDQAGYIIYSLQDLEQDTREGKLFPHTGVTYTTWRDSSGSIVYPETVSLLNWEDHTDESVYVARFTPADYPASISLDSIPVLKASITENPEDLSPVSPNPEDIAETLQGDWAIEIPRS